MLEELLEVAKNVGLIANHTPVLSSRTLNDKLRCEVYFKCENFQRGGAFKFRGAYNAISKLSEEQKQKGIITHSSGNHAQAVALVGKILGIKTTIVMPENAPEVKYNATKGYGAGIVTCESTIEARVERCNALIDEYGYTLVHPFDNQNIINGAASASIELIDEVGDLDYLIAPVGGGGLISGSSKYAKLSGRAKQVIAAEPEMASDAYDSFVSGVLVRKHEHPPNTIGDGLRTLLSELTFEHVQKYVDQIITISEEEIKSAMEFLWYRMKIIVEPSSATALAALTKGVENGSINQDSKIGIILSGGNVDLQLYFDSLIK